MVTWPLSRSICLLHLCRKSSILKTTRLGDISTATRELQCAEYSLQVRFNTSRTSSTRTLPKSQVSNSSTGGSTITSTDGEGLGEMFPSENCRESVARDTTNESHRDRTAESRASPQNLTTMQFPYHGLGGTVDLRFCNSTLPYRCSLGSSPNMTGRI